MPSLPWILALTLTFLHCLSAAPTINSENKIAHLTRDILSEIDTLKKTSCPTEDSTFYITSNVPVECIETMLQCASKELNVVASECFGNTSDVENYRACSRTRDAILYVLKEKTGGKIQDESTNCYCEGSQTKPYQEFLSDLETLIQKLNTKN